MCLQPLDILSRQMGKRKKISHHRLDLNHRPLHFWSSVTLSHHPGGIFAFIYQHIIIINCFTVKQNKWRNEDNELKTSEVLTVCQQHVFMLSKYYDVGWPLLFINIIKTFSNSILWLSSDDGTITVTLPHFITFCNSGKEKESKVHFCESWTSTYVHSSHIT